VDGATVILFPVLLGPKAGTVMTPLARATTDSTGRFTIRLPVSGDALLANSKSAGALNLQVVAFYPGGEAIWFTPIPVGAPRLAPLATLRLHTVVATAGAIGQLDEPHNCVSGKPSVLSGFPVTVGYKSSEDIHLAGTSFSYTTGVTNTMGAGVSFSGPDGGFSASGSTSENDSTGVTFPNLPGAGSNTLQAGGAYYDQEVICDHAQPYWHIYQDAIGGFDGTPGAAAVKAGDCFTAPANQPVIINTTRQATFSSGVQLEKDGLNLNLSAEDGYSSSATLTYNLGDNSAPYCGVSNFPGATQPPAPGFIQVHAES
jgi:hypothetical protein